MIIGIDLGTTNSLVGCFREGKVEIRPNRLGKHLTPSVVSVDSDGTVYVGETAKERGILYPLETAKVFKRNMGTDKEFVLSGKKYRAEELSSLVLRSLKEDAENYLGEEVEEAIISVPAYFNDLQRKATKQAGELAGLTVKRIINEPTAAALAYGMDHQGLDLRYLVFDLGGGTFDISVLELHDFIMEVHAIAGDNFLGGENFTDLLAALFLEKVKVDIESLDYRTMNKLFKAAEEWKIAFTYNSVVNMAFTIEDELYEYEMEEEEYEKACAPLFEKLRRPIERSLRDASLTLDDIDEIVLVGGATRMPIVKRFVQKMFGSLPKGNVDPDEAIVIGAALQCGIKSRDKEITEIVMTDVCPYTLGTDVVVDNGLFEESGHYLPIIERNTVIPVSRTSRLYTAHDNQTRISVKILQGESRMAYNNLLLGEINVPVPQGPKGKEAIDITYTYDVNSLLEVEVTVVSTGVHRRLIIQNDKNKLSDEEVEERIKKLAHLKQSPREEEANKLILLRGERMYEEATRDLRIKIDRAMMQFEHALSKQDRREIERERKVLEKFLDELEFTDEGFESTTTPVMFS